MTPAILSVPGATLRIMDTLSNISDTSYQLPLSEADQTALRPALLDDLGTMPFESGALISRSLWVIFIGERGVWTHAVLPCSVPAVRRSGRKEVARRQGHPCMSGGLSPARGPGGVQHARTST